MLGTKIVLDEEKIKKDNVYSVDSVYETIDKIAKECKLVKQDKYTYICPRGELDSPRLGSFIYNYLRDYDWFTLNVKEWILLDDDEGNDDLIVINKQKKKGVWA